MPSPSEIPKGPTMKLHYYPKPTASEVAAHLVAIERALDTLTASGEP